MSDKNLSDFKAALDLDNTEVAALCGVSPATARNWDSKRTKMSNEAVRLLGMLSKMKAEPDMKCGDLASIAVTRAKESAVELRKKR